MEFWKISIPFLKTLKESQTNTYEKVEGNALYSHGTCYILLSNSAVLFKVCLKFLFEIYLQCFLIFIQNFKTDPLVGHINHSVALFFSPYQLRQGFFFLTLQVMTAWSACMDTGLLKQLWGGRGHRAATGSQCSLPQTTESWEIWATTLLLGDHNLLYT